MIVSNSSPLILLAKINKLSLLKQLYKRIAIPTEVYREVVEKGKEDRYADAFLIEKLIGEVIFIIQIKNKYKKEIKKLKKSIGSGESEAIALSQQEKAKLLLIDDLEPRKIAQVKNIEIRGTLGILLKALVEKILTYDGYEKCIKDLTKHAYLSNEIVIEFLEKGYEFSKQIKRKKLSR